MKPGDSTSVLVSFSMHEGMDGPHNFSVTFKTNDKVEPQKVVSVKANFVK